MASGTYNYSRGLAVRANPITRLRQVVIGIYLNTLRTEKKLREIAMIKFDAKKF